MSGVDWHIEHLGPSHYCDGFSCSRPNLDSFLQRKARDQEHLHWGRTYVAIDPSDEDRRVAGYYTISAGAILRGAVPIDKPEAYPNLPVIHIGRLAVDMESQQQGLGTTLLLNIYKTAVEVAESVGVCGVNLFAGDDAAKEWYAKRGFEDTRDDNPYHMFAYLGTIRELFEFAQTDPAQDDLF